jgi:hypothetical protein
MFCLYMALATALRSSGSLVRRPGVSRVGLKGMMCSSPTRPYDGRLP